MPAVFGDSFNARSQWFDHGLWGKTMNMRAVMLPNRKTKTGRLLFYEGIFKKFNWRK